MERRSLLPVLAVLTCAAGARAAHAVEAMSAPHLFQPATCQAAPFNDVPANHPFCAWIQQLKADQISLGCNGGNFCPDDPVDRQDIAALLERAMRGTSNWEPWRGAFHRTLIVNPKVYSLDPVQSGDRLLGHLAEITDATADNPYLIKLEPGVYDLDGNLLTLKPFVDLEGSGEGTTVIRSARNGTAVAGADDAELRELTIENPGAGATSRGIDLTGDTTRLLHVTVVAAGGTGVNEAIGAVGTGARLTHVTARATATGAATAVGIVISGNAVLQGVDVSVGGLASARGITGFAGSSVIEDATVTAGGGTFVYGVNFETGASATLRRVNATAASIVAGATAAGLHLLDGNVAAYDSSFSGGAANSFGARAERIANTHTLRLHRSRLSATDHTVEGDTGYTIQIGDSQLAGGSASANGATLTCYGVYDENFSNGGGLAACP